MKIAITGHTHGIGKEFAEQLSKRDHEIIGISRRDGENIRRVPHTATLIEPADLFINNAQSNYAQTELLYEVWNRWANWLPVRHKWIWNISTQMTQSPIDISVGGHDDITMTQYRNQKLALEEASRQLQYTEAWPHISIIRPGAVYCNCRDASSNANF
jgi:putative NADH-flavin reductase